MAKNEELTSWTMFINYYFILLPVSLPCIDTGLWRFYTANWKDLKVEICFQDCSEVNAIYTIL